ncbi:MAG TPA: cytochrome c [Steroidobacteraceae bacterium]|jgi:mono/diheme cytochrome c family protein|nr:cytochrome c [Steroidobacteraceae bacterium]
MKRSKIIVVVVVVALLAIMAWIMFVPGPMAFAAGQRVALAQYHGNPTGVPADLTAADPLAHGRYLAQAADCEACHTAEGGQPFAGGRPFQTSFGTIYSPNITPDVKTGIGSWSDADFLAAVHEGRDKNGEHLYPAFPYAAYTYLTDQDVLAIKAYIFSVPPVSNVAPSNTLRFPYNQRALMAIWAMLYDPDKRFEPVADRSPTWNRGAYLVEALGHCGDCHTPRTLLQALNNREKFKGGMAEGWRAYNLSSDAASGIGSWTPSELLQYLSTGHSMNRGSAFGPMAQAVHLSFQNLTPSDLGAITEYVRSVPPIASADLPAPKLARSSQYPTDDSADPAMATGRHLFAGTCSGCHTWTGANDFVPYATLTGTRAVNDPTATNVALAILRGASPLPASGAIATMPAFGSVWNDDQIAAVSNYVIARFGAQPSSISPAEVGKLRATL